MIDNIINDNHGSIGQCCLSYCRTLSNIVVLTTRSLIILYLTTRGLIILYLTTIVTMIDYIINDNHGSIGQCSLSDCRTLLNIVVLTTRSLIILYLTTRGLIILYLTTIVTMVDNIINDNHGSIGQCCLSYCRTLLNIVVLTTRSLIFLY